MLTARVIGFIPLPSAPISAGTQTSLRLVSEVMPSHGCRRARASCGFTGGQCVTLELDDRYCWILGGYCSVLLWYRWQGIAGVLQYCWRVEMGCWWGLLFDLCCHWRVTSLSPPVHRLCIPLSIKCRILIQSRSEGCGWYFDFQAPLLPFSCLLSVTTRAIPLLSSTYKKPF